MDLITNLFDMDLAALVPDMPVVMVTVGFLLVLAVLAGPILLVTMGALYLFKPAPEANFKYGFRTYFGMGSIQAWQFSQKIGGLAFAGLGVPLLLAMLIMALTFIGKDLLQVATTATICLLWQAGLTLIARITVAVLCGIYFDKNGNPRK